MKLDEELGDKTGIAIDLGNIGVVYKNKGDYLKALDYYFKALKMKEELKDKWEIAITLGNIGLIYKEQGDYPIALEYYYQTLKILEELGDKKGMTISYINIGELYAQRGEYIKAIENLTKGLEIAKEVGALLQEQSAYRYLAEVYEKQKDYKKAYEYHKEYSIAKDSLFNEEKSKDIGKLEAKHEFETAEMERKRKEEEQARIETELKSRRDNLQYSGILIFLVVLLIAILFSGRLALPIRLAEGVVFFTFLLFFEFTLVLLDPYIENWTGGEPAYKLAINAGLAGLIFPLHQFFETMLKQRIFKAKRRKITKRPIG